MGPTFSDMVPPIHLRYIKNPRMDENFHIKSSIFGCLFSPISNHPNLDDYCLSFSIVADIIYNHPILDVSCRQFLDENYTLLLSTNIGCFLSSMFG